MNVQTKNSIKWGIIGGLASIVTSLIIHLAGLPIDSKISYISVLALILVCIMAMIEQRDKHQDGLIGFGKCIGTSVLTSLFAGLIAAVYMYISLKFLFPENLDVIKELTIQTLEDQGRTEEEIEQIMEFSTMFTSAGFLSIMSILSFVFYGLITGLIGGAFIKREN